METFKTYDPEDYYDELIDENGRPRSGAQLLIDKIESLPEGDLALRQREAEASTCSCRISITIKRS